MDMEKKTSVLREVHAALGEMWDPMIQLRHGCFDWCATHRRGGHFPFQIDCGEMGPDTSVVGLSHDDAPLSFENHHSDLYQHSLVDSIALIPTLDDEHARYLVLLQLCKNVQNDEVKFKIQYVEMRLPSFIIVVKSM
jgi:hypothetical protein